MEVAELMVRRHHLPTFLHLVVVLVLVVSEQSSRRSPVEAVVVVLVPRDTPLAVRAVLLPTQVGQVMRVPVETQLEHVLARVVPAVVVPVVLHPME
jgi:hypothetical protein